VHEFELGRQEEFNGGEVRGSELRNSLGLNPQYREFGRSFEEKGIEHAKSKGRERRDVK